MMKLAVVQCPNPSCGGVVYEAVVENDGFLAECPKCGQFNRVAGNAIGKEITGLCDSCGYPLDDMHIFGRETFVCKPGRKKK